MAFTEQQAEAAARWYAEAACLADFDTGRKIPYAFIAGDPDEFRARPFEQREILHAREEAQRQHSETEPTVEQQKIFYNALVEIIHDSLTGKRGPITLDHVLVLGEKKVLYTVYDGPKAGMRYLCLSSNEGPHYGGSSCEIQEAIDRAGILSSYHCYNTLCLIEDGTICKGDIKYNRFLDYGQSDQDTPIVIPIVACVPVGDLNSGPG